MRCTNCGLPLSPTNTSLNCPRCHNALVSEAKPVAVYPALPPVVQTPFPQAGQMWQPDLTPPPLSTPEPMEATVRNNSSSDMRDARTAGNPSRGQVMTYSKPAPVMRRTSNTGFILAGLCVITGGLILVFVYFMASGLPSTGITNASTGTAVATRDAFPTPTTALPSPTVVPSPTAGTYAGQQYIDNAQMASIVN